MSVRGRQFICACLAACLSAACQAEVFEARVVGITDGDTITVVDTANQQFKIRLTGIDAPERGQDYGDKSKANLSAVVFGRDVEVEWAKRDRYGRIVGKVIATEGSCNNPTCPKTRDAGLYQVATGFAWWYRDYAKEQAPEDRGLYEQAEFNAKIRRFGLWSGTNPMAPWEYRKGR